MVNSVRVILAGIAVILCLIVASNITVFFGYLGASYQSLVSDCFAALAILAIILGLRG